MSPVLQYLPGTDGKPRNAVWMKSRRAALAALLKGQTVTYAWDDGAINLWVDDEGNFRANHCYHLNIIDSLVTTNIEEVRTWLADNLPKEVHFPK
jgi:hypothetical protein